MIETEIRKIGPQATVAASDHQGPGRGSERSRKSWPRGHLDSGFPAFRPMRECNFFLLKPPNLWYFVTEPQETNTPSNNVQSLCLLSNFTTALEIANNSSETASWGWGFQPGFYFTILDRIPEGEPDPAAQNPHLMREARHCPRGPSLPMPLPFTINHYLHLFPLPTAKCLFQTQMSLSNTNTWVL